MKDDVKKILANISMASALLNTIDTPAKRKILLYVINNKTISVSEMVIKLHMMQSYISNQLNQLKKLNLVTYIEDPVNKKARYYKTNIEQLKKLDPILQQLIETCATQN